MSNNSKLIIDYKYTDAHVTNAHKSFEIDLLNVCNNLIAGEALKNDRNIIIKNISIKSTETKTESFINFDWRVRDEK